MSTATTTTEIFLYDHRGLNLADTYTASSSDVYAIGDFIKKVHPGFDNEVRVWKVVSITHNFGVTPSTKFIHAWEVDDSHISQVEQDRYQNL